MNTHISLIRELLATGLTQKALGELLGKSQAWVGAVLAGKFDDIKWGDGEALRALHAERCGKPSPAPDDTPQTDRRDPTSPGRRAANHDEVA